ncbi:hypothetical protein [Burkholderia glumae]|uniref:hypothetical protein n=1 Tax=Burkholderia glumae TaxID=337 RepID=UPI001C25E057|nr:hypothetical protein [Burkholderia glumae]
MKHRFTGTRRNSRQRAAGFRGALFFVPLAALPIRIGATAPGPRSATVENVDFIANFRLISHILGNLAFSIGTKKKRHGGPWR